MTLAEADSRLTVAKSIDGLNTENFGSSITRSRRVGNPGSVLLVLPTGSFCSPGRHKERHCGSRSTQGILHRETLHDSA